MIDDKFYCHYNEDVNKYYYEFVPSDYSLALVESIAEEKANYTVDKNQDDKKRSTHLKINKQLEGCLAEFAVAKFLINIFGESPNNIRVYDSEREF